VRVIAPDVGGGFGGKIHVSPEEILTTLVARRLGKPAKYTESRSETMLAAHHGRDQIQKLTLAARRDGTVTGLKVELIADMGAYLGLVTPGVPLLGAFMFNAIYKFPAYRFECTNVFTNKTLTDAYRGAGRPEATYAIERLMDTLAHELGMDPLAVREKNWIKHEEFPFTTVCGLTYDSGNYEAATSKAVDMFDYAGLRREQEERRARKDVIQLGIGVSTFTEMCGLAPSRVLGSLSYGASLVLFILALGSLGSARTGAFFSLGPFVGAAIAIPLLGENLDLLMIPAAAAMAVGAYLLVTEHHVHLHRHERVVHTHPHATDEHHQHRHPPGTVEPHVHEHEHPEVVHSHAHWPDQQHRHQH